MLEKVQLSDNSGATQELWMEFMRRKPSVASNLAIAQDRSDQINRNIRHLSLPNIHNATPQSMTNIAAGSYPTSNQIGDTSSMNQNPLTQ